MLIDVLLCVAITCIVVHSEIFRSTRDLIESLNKTTGYWIRCPMCFGFWVGLIYAVIFGLSPLSIGLLSSFFSWSAYNFITAFGALGDYYTYIIDNGEE